MHLWYPFPFPAWAWGITILNVCAMLAWVISRGHWIERQWWWAGTIPGIFLVGGCHTFVCVAPWLAALVFFPIWTFLVASAVLGAVVYWLNFFLAVRDWRREPKLSRGFVIGLAIGVLLPMAAQGLIFGPPWR